MYIIIIGCGRLGSHLAKKLSDDGNDVCMIDRSSDRLETLGSGFNGQRIKGIEFDSDVLAEAGVTHADTLLAVTVDDNVNITVSLIAEKIYHVPKIIARVNNPGKKFVYSQLNIDTINPIQYEAEIIKRKLSLENLDVVLSLDNNFEIIELLVSKEKSSSVGAIEKEYGCIISGLIKDGIVRLPNESEVIHCGDRFICTIPKKDKGRLVNSFSKEILL